MKKEGALRARAEQRVAELERELRGAGGHRATASNSSLPPSANPIGAKPPVVKKPTGRKPGGQLGHPGKSRTLLPVERVDHVVEHRPAVCAGCQQALAPGAPGEVVGRHQVAELPPRAVEVTEHQALACRCGRCGRVSRGSIPDDVRASAIGPRLSAAIGLLGASMKGSRRAIAQMMREVLGCPVGLGSVCAREKELCGALAGPHQTLVAAAAHAKVKYVDETPVEAAGQGPLAVRVGRPRAGGVPRRQGPDASGVRGVVRQRRGAGRAAAGRVLHGSGGDLRRVEHQVTPVVLGAPGA